MNIQKWLNDREVAQRYSVSRITVWRWAREGRIPKPHKISTNTTRWHIDDIEANDRKRRGEVA